ncbi:hypothetical protein Pcinc_001145 [Petrolisthes cinctipes]|uniref:Regulatory protein zeste n=1 Tax=Petrolisthes cinctipes TaxID=88211 RepID=A0AAE1GJH5_PETCI|nr:hypothetical protein Pcinc_018751 [Petrolisthes cinctipes]KAK3893652.1 hypothetical protein Pcinc_002565 [Petrolisthes cinctipes]KAK3895130.1 hypothetical protein Pcinc_001145 [Petrolisthes cinctipes]
MSAADPLGIERPVDAGIGNTQRMQHMGEKERLLLLDLILSRATDARTIPVKAQAWEEVTNSLTASGKGSRRTVKQVKKDMGKYEIKAIPSAGECA